jgi:hypothetical protein
MITEDMIKQIFFYCNNDDPNGLYTDPSGEALDVLEYARKIEAVIQTSVRLQEHKRCVDLVRFMNKDIARVLEDNKPA